MDQDGDAGGEADEGDQVPDGEQGHIFEGTDEDIVVGEELDEVGETDEVPCQPGVPVKHGTVEPGDGGIVLEDKEEGQGRHDHQVPCLSLPDPFPECLFHRSKRPVVSG